MNTNLSHPEVQKYIDDNLQVDLIDLVLKGIPFDEVTSQEIAQQITGKNIMGKKAPSFVKTGVLFPKKLNLEQSSSEQTARYKAVHLPMYKPVIADITGGFGIDLFFMSEQCPTPHYCDVDVELAQLVKYNFSLHDRKVIIHTMNGIHWVENESADLDIIYVDPSRRKNSQRHMTLEQSSPNIVEHWELLLSKAKWVMAKVSPMLDIQYLAKNLPHIHSIHVLSVQNDLKEILLMASVNETTNNPMEVIAADIDKENTNRFCTTLLSRQSVTMVSDNLDEYQYVFEPFSCLLKAQCQDQAASELGFLKLDAFSHLYFSKGEVQSPLFKSFKIKTIFKSLPKKCKENFGDRIHVITRNYPTPPKEILKKIKAKEGGNLYLICSKRNNKPIYILAERF